MSDGDTAAGHEFFPYPKLHRLRRDILITEKIDGTNAAIVLMEDGTLYAQSRTRVLTPTKAGDNFGFARWVAENQEALRGLGPGIHYGEWWGQGIQRGYGLTEKRFSLFNAQRWCESGQAAIVADVAARVPALSVVPVLYEGPWVGNMVEIGSDGASSYKSSVDAVETVLLNLRRGGSVAARGFMAPEGIVVLHKASRIGFKVALENDTEHKSARQVVVATA